MKKLISILLLFSISSLFAQKNKIDSLTTVLHESVDTIKVKIYNELSWELKYTNPDTAFFYGQEAYLLSDKIRYDRGKADALHKMGIVLWVQGKLNEAVDTTKAAIKLYKKLQVTKSVAGCINNLAAIYSSQGNYEEALKSYQASYNLKLELGDSIGMVSSLTNLGNVNINNGEFEEGLEYYHKSLQLALKTKNIEIYKLVDIYNNLGIAYRNVNNIDSSLYYYNQNLNLCKDNNLLMPYSKGLSNVGTLYFKNNSLDTALTYYLEAYKIQKEINTTIHLGRTTTNIAEVYRKKKDFNTALQYANEAREYVFQSSSLKEQQTLYHLYSDIYADQGNYKQAHNYLTKYESLHDSLVNIEKSKELAKLDALYQFEKKEKEIIQLESDKKIAQKETNIQRLYKNIAFSGVLAAIVIILLVINRMRISRKLFRQKEELITAKEAEARLLLENEKLESEKLKTEIESKNRELSSNALATSQKNELLSEVDNKIKELEKAANIDNHSKLRELKFLIKENRSIETDWQNFKVHFDNVHPNFYQKLTAEYPELSQNDLKHCAYIRVNLTSKEIARIMNISPKSVQMSRYRLKKKFGLTAEHDLFEFINGLL